MLFVYLCIRVCVCKAARLWMDWRRWWLCGYPDLRQNPAFTDDDDDDDGQRAHQHQSPQRNARICCGWCFTREINERTNASRSSNQRIYTNVYMCVMWLCVCIGTHTLYTYTQWWHAYIVHGEGFISLVSWWAPPRWMDGCTVPWHTPDVRLYVCEEERRWVVYVFVCVRMKPTHKKTINQHSTHKIAYLGAYIEEYVKSLKARRRYRRRRRRHHKNLLGTHAGRTPIARP